MPSLSEDVLIALHEEIAALMRAGVPLDSGLLALSKELPGKLGASAKSVGEELAKGEKLSVVLDGLSDSFSPAHAAIVEAGLRSGQLTSALENVSSTLRRASDLRKVLRISVVYPVFIATFAYVLFLYIVLSWAPSMVATYRETFRDTFTRTQAVLETLQATALVWAPTVPVLIVVGLFLWLRSTNSNRRSGWLRSPLASVLYSGRIATFAELLALLIERNTPLPQAVELAAVASGDKAITKAATTIGSELERGGTPSNQPAIPPLLTWLIASGHHQPRLAEACRRTARYYHERATRQAHWLSHAFPLWLTAILGGASVAVVAIATYGLWMQILYNLVQQSYGQA